jgi:hypothetical protein
MKVKIFAFADDIPRLESAVNIWLGQAGNYKEIISTTQHVIFDDFTKKVMVTIFVWYK